MDINRYLKKVTVNRNVIDKLAVESWRDRLGVFIVFEFHMFPNESISYSTILEWFKHILAISGYTYEHVKDLRGGEMCECWINPQKDYAEMHVQHKYLSFKTCVFIKRVLWNYCRLSDIRFSYRKLN